MAKITEILQK